MAGESAVVHLDFLKDLLVVFALGGAVVYAVRAVRLPAIVGLLVAGAAMGPHGLSLVADVHRVETLAEIGVVLLLFTIGVELSLAQVLRMWRVIVGAGGGQVVLCIGAVAAAATALSGDWGQRVFFGFLAALSSTAIVLRILDERAQLSTPFGRITLGVLLFQDLCIVPLMLLTPFLAGYGAGGGELVGTLLKAAGVVVGVVVAARRLVPFILLKVVQTRSRELFFTTILVLCLGTAWLTSLAGLSLALGAFLAGLAVSESEYSHQALVEAIPFRDAFVSLFFVSIGMLMDVSFVLEHLPAVLAGVVFIVVVKTVTAGLPPLLAGYPLRVAAQVGLGLAQIGEFSFVLSRVGREVGLIGPVQYQVFLSASVTTMVLTPALLAAGRFVGARLPHAALPVAPSVDAGEDMADDEPLNDHVLIAGYGVNGHNLARALEAAGIPYAVLEMNPETVRAARARGEPVHYGDCSRAPVLQAFGIDRARMYVVAISDAASTRQSVSVARSLNPSLRILARTRFVSELEELRQLGADEVVPEEFETAVEIFARVLHHFDVPRNVILDRVASVREGMYEILREPRPAGAPARASGVLEGIHVESVEIREASPAVGRSVVDLDLRARTRASALAVKREAETHPSPDAAFRFQAGDVLLLMGDQEALDAALTLLDPQAPVS